jgi:hypothetical protein
MRSLKLGEEVESDGRKAYVARCDQVLFVGETIVHEGTNKIVTEVRRLSDGPPALQQWALVFLE